MVSNYFDIVEEHISLYSEIILNYSLNKKFYNNYKGYISGKIIFDNQSCLEFMEVKDTEIFQKDKYSYHYMDSENTLIFRYDNADHHRQLKTFPHHKHLPEHVENSKEPDIQQVLFEIKALLTETS